MSPAVRVTAGVAARRPDHYLQNKAKMIIEPEMKAFPAMSSLEKSLAQNGKLLLGGLGENVEKCTPVVNEDYEEQIEKLKNTEEREFEGLCGQSKKIKKVNDCGHADRPHYAKNMCNPCYHKFGRTKKPWKCNHEKLYAHGLCQNCYINDYNKKRSQKPKDDKLSTGTDGEIETLASTTSTEEPLTMEDKMAFVPTDECQSPENQH